MISDKNWPARALKEMIKRANKYSKNEILTSSLVKLMLQHAFHLGEITERQKHKP
jgi:hypothetical protein